MATAAAKETTTMAKEEEEEEAWREDDFLSFEAATTDNEQQQQPSDATITRAVPESSASDSEPPPWMEWMTSTLRSSMQQQRSRWGPPVASPLVQLHNEMVALQHLLEPTPSEVTARQQLVAHVSDILKTEHNKTSQAKASWEDNPDVAKGGNQYDMDIHVFGSQATGLYLPTSDIDLVVLLTPRGGAVDTEDKEDSSAVDATRLLERLAVALESHPSFQPREKKDATNTNNNSGVEEEKTTQQEGYPVEWELVYLQVITQTRVPLIKCSVQQKGADAYDRVLHVDISVQTTHNNQNTALAVQWIQDCLARIPVLKPLTMTLKYFLALRELNEPYTGGVGSYLLQLMILSFLQQQYGAILSSGNLHPSYQQQCYCLGSLLLEFLELYGLSLNFWTTGITVRREGSYFPKGLVRAPPPTMEGTSADTERDAPEALFWNPARPGLLAVEDPLDPAKDVGKGSFRFGMVQRSFAVAFKCLLAQLTEPQDPRNPSSILVSILPVRDELRARANMIREEASKKRKRTDGNDASSNLSRG